MLLFTVGAVRGDDGSSWRCRWFEMFNEVIRVWCNVILLWLAFYEFIVIPTDQRFTLWSTIIVYLLAFEGSGKPPVIKVIFGCFIIGFNTSYSIICVIYIIISYICFYSISFSSGVQVALMAEAPTAPCDDFLVHHNVYL